MYNQPQADEQVSDATRCQPSFYIIGVMKGASTHLANQLSAFVGSHGRHVGYSGILVHKYEHHFWEGYPAIDWHLEHGDLRAMNGSNLEEIARRGAEAMDAMEDGLVRGNGTYAPGDAAANLCHSLVRDFAPRGGGGGGGGGFSGNADGKGGDTTRINNIRSTCLSAQRTLASSLLVHHELVKRVFPHPNLVPNLTVGRAINSATFMCDHYDAIGIKAPSHISEYYVPLRLAACTGAATRFIISLRDPIARAYSAWSMKASTLHPDACCVVNAAALRIHSAPK